MLFEALSFLNVEGSILKLSHFQTLRATRRALKQQAISFSFVPHSSRLKTAHPLHGFHPL